MAAKIEERIESLEQRLRQLKTQKQRSEARARISAARNERRAELRRRILVGTVVLARAERGVLDAAALQAWLDEGLDKTDDRALFGLPSRP